MLRISFVNINSKISGDWGLGIGDWGIGVWAPNPKPQPQNPKPKHQEYFIKKKK